MNLEVLIDEVEKRKPLWDFTRKEYKSREVTAQNWIEIGNIFNASRKYLTFIRIVLCGISKLPVKF